jgi:hypothetical protein
MTRPARLVESHYQDLVDSGLSLATILAANVYSASAAEVEAILGYGAGTGLAFPYPPNGGPPFVRVKLDRTGKKRYRTAKGAGNHLYTALVPPEQLADPSIDAYVTEGEKKSLRLMQEGRLTIGLAGIWSWKTTLPDGSTGPLPELDSVAWNGRQVFIVFDADPKPKTVADVRRAEAALAGELIRRGALVSSIRLPLADEQDKSGIDDYLLTHSLAEFDRLPRIRVEAPRWAPPDDRPQIDAGNLLDVMAREAWSAIARANDPPRLFRYGTSLAWLTADVESQITIEALSREHVRHHLADVATFVRFVPGGRGKPAVPKPTLPPEALAADLLCVPDPTLPRLTRVVRVPVFSAEGRLLTTAGYAPSSGLYLAMPADLTVPPVPMAPSHTACDDAVGWLAEEFLGDFPFATDADRAHVVALLVTLVLREMIDGHLPLFVFSKPLPRSGATLLVRCLSFALGREPVPVRTLSAQPRGDAQEVDGRPAPGPVAGRLRQRAWAPR